MSGEQKNSIFRLMEWRVGASIETKKLRSAEENMKQNATSGVITSGMRIMKNIPWPALNPSYKRFQRLPELSMVKQVEEPALRGFSAPVLANLSELSQSGRCSGQPNRIFTSSA